MPDLRCLALVLEALPDEAARLEERRGRDDRFVQRATIAVLRHERSLVRELNRSARCAASARYQDKPKVDNDGKLDVSRTPQTGSCNFSRASLLESREPDDMVRQLQEQGRTTRLRRAPRLRRQGRGQSRARPVARPARPPTPTGESARRPASTEGPAIFGERRSRGSATGCTWPPGTRSQWSSTSPKRREPRPKS